MTIPQIILLKISVFQDTFFWDWGALFEIEIENLADFAHWLNEQDFDDNYRIREYSDLQELVHNYEKDCDETEED